MSLPRERSFVELTVNGQNIATLATEPEEEKLPQPPPSVLLPPPKPLTERQNTNEAQRSFVELTIRGNTVGSVETMTPPPDVLMRHGDSISRDGRESPRRGLWWSIFECNVFESRKETSDELTAKLQQQEEDSLSSASSLRDRNLNPSRVPRANAQFLQQQQQQQQLQPAEHFSQQHIHTPGNHARNVSNSLLHNSIQSQDAMCIIKQNLDAKHREKESLEAIDIDGSDGCLPKPRRLEEFSKELRSLLVDLIEYSKAKTWKKKVLTVVLFAISTLVFYDLFFGREDFIVTWLHSFVVWMTTHHAAAVFAFVGIFVVSTLAFVPPTLLVFGAGYAFTVALDNVFVGVAAATVSSFLGSCIGAILAFLRSRYMMRDLVKLLANRYPLVRTIDQSLKVNHGFRIMLLLRFCPILPFNGLNYCCGITGVRLYDFTLSLIGILPFQIYTIVLGATAGAVELQNLQHDDYTRGEMAAFVCFIVTGVLFGLVAVAYAWSLVKQALKQELGVTAEEFEYLVRPARSRVDGEMEIEIMGGLSPSTSYHLQDDGDGDAATNKSGIHHSRTNTAASNGGVRLQEEGEEWFWMWV